MLLPAFLLVAAVSAMSHPFVGDVVVGDGLGLAEDERGYWVPRVEEGVVVNEEALDWMARSTLIHNRTLAEITLPGTHDSGAYWLSKLVEPTAFPKFPTEMIELAERLHVPVDKIVAAFALAQDRDFYMQAQQGVRYFDVRCGWNGTEWVIFHGLEGHTVVTVLSDVRRYVNEHQGEVFVLELTHFLGNPTEGQVNDLRLMVERVFDGVMCTPPKGGGKWATIGQMIKKNKRVVVIMEADYGGNVWNSSTIYNTYANSDSIDTMHAYDDDQVKVFVDRTWGKESPLFKISYTLTTQTKTVVEAVLPGHPRSLKDLATSGNAVIAKWAETHARVPYPRLGNVFIVDFCAEMDLVGITQRV